jgi:hypothetical protein
VTAIDVERILLFELFSNTIESCGTHILRVSRERGARCALARRAGESIKPGVERSGTPGYDVHQFQARETGGSRNRLLA